jgi:hypothetical protein
MTVSSVGHYVMVRKRPRAAREVWVLRCFDCGWSAETSDREEAFRWEQQHPHPRVSAG